MSRIDVAVVGSGPNGLAAAVTMARAGLSVHLFERDATLGGGARTAELTLPGFRHDICSAVHPLALASGFFRRFGLERRIDLVVPELSYGHPLDGGRAGLAWRDLDRTASDLGVDGPAWRRLMAPLVAHADRVAQIAGSPVLQLPRHPVTLAAFGLRVLEQGSAAWDARFRAEAAPAMLAGIGAHAIQPMPSIAAAAVSMSLGTYAHARGWPVPVGGSQSIADAMVADLVAHGGRVHPGTDIGSLDELPAARAMLLDVSPKALATIAGDRLPRGYLRRLARFRYGNAASKVDFALSAPVPWTNPALALAGTLHLGGSHREIAAAEADVAAGRHSANPFVLVAQPSIADPSRAPAGQHVLWAYTHVPRGSREDQTEAVTRQIERFAPGFRDVILASAGRTAVDLAEHNPNYVGGDISSGAATLDQLIARPLLARDPWRTPADGIYLCSSSTAPGPGVHGLAGYYAARSALRNEFGVTAMPSLAP